MHITDAINKGHIVFDSFLMLLYLSQTREENINPQSSDHRCFDKRVLAVRQSQQYRDTQHLCLILQIFIHT